jgi:hypothetical protein
LVFNLTDSYFKAKELVRLGEIAVAEGDIDSFLAVRFHRSEKIDTRRIVLGDSTYDFYLYDVAYIAETETGFVVKEGMTFLLQLIEGDGMPDYTQVLFQSGEADVVEQLGIRVFELPIYSGIDQVSMASVILVEKLKIDGVFQVVDTIEWQVDDVAIGSIMVQITAADFTIGAELETYLSEHGSVPTEPFGTVRITAPLVIDTTMEIFIAGLTYLSAVALITILLFKRNKNRMGKKPPTNGLKRDIEKIHSPKL